MYIAYTYNYAYRCRYGYRYRYRCIYGTDIDTNMNVNTAIDTRYSCMYTYLTMHVCLYMYIICSRHTLYDIYKYATYNHLYTSIHICRAEAVGNGQSRAQGPVLIQSFTTKRATAAASARTSRESSAVRKPSNSTEP